MLVAPVLVFSVHVGIEKFVRDIVGGRGYPEVVYILISSLDNRVSHELIGVCGVCEMGNSIILSLRFPRAYSWDSLVYSRRPL